MHPDATRSSDYAAHSSGNAEDVPSALRRRFLLLERLVREGDTEATEDLGDVGDAEEAALEVLRHLAHLAAADPGSVPLEDLDLFAEHAAERCSDFEDDDPRLARWSRVALPLAVEAAGHPCPDATVTARRRATRGLLRLLVWLTDCRTDPTDPTDPAGERTDPTDPTDPAGERADAADPYGDLTLAVEDLQAAAEADPSPYHLRLSGQAFATRYFHTGDPADRASAIGRLTELLSFDLEPSLRAAVALERAAFAIDDVRDGDRCALQLVLDDVGVALPELDPDAGPGYGIALHLHGEALLARAVGAVDPVDASAMLDVATALRDPRACEPDGTTEELCLLLLLTGLPSLLARRRWDPRVDPAVDLLAELRRNPPGGRVDEELQLRCSLVLSDCYAARAVRLVGDTAAHRRDVVSADDRRAAAHADLGRSVALLQQAIDAHQGPSEERDQLRRVLIGRLYDHIQTNRAWPLPPGVTLNPARAGAGTLAPALTDALREPSVITDLRRARDELARLPDWTGVEEVAPLIEWTAGMSEQRIPRSVPTTDGIGPILAVLTRLADPNAEPLAPGDVGAAVRELRRFDRTLGLDDSRRPALRLVLGLLLASGPASGDTDVAGHRHVARVLGSAAPALVDAAPSVAVHLLRRAVDALARSTLIVAAADPSPSSSEGTDPDGVNPVSVVLSSWLDRSTSTAQRLRLRAAADAAAAGYPGPPSPATDIEVGVDTEVGDDIRVGDDTEVGDETAEERRLERFERHVTELLESTDAGRVAAALMSLASAQHQCGNVEEALTTGLVALRRLTDALAPTTPAGAAGAEAAGAEVAGAEAGAGAEAARAGAGAEAAAATAAAAGAEADRIIERLLDWCAPSDGRTVAVELAEAAARPDRQPSTATELTRVLLGAGIDVAVYLLPWRTVVLHASGETGTGTDATSHPEPAEPFDLVPGGSGLQRDAFDAAIERALGIVRRRGLVRPVRLVLIPVEPLREVPWHQEVDVTSLPGSQPVTLSYVANLRQLDAAAERWDSSDAAARLLVVTTDGPAPSGEDVAERVQATGPGCVVVCLSDPQPDVGLADRLLDAGASSVILGPTGDGLGALVVQVFRHWLAGRTPAEALRRTLQWIATPDEAAIPVLPESVQDTLSVFGGSGTDQLSNYACHGL
jgi:hypothetical protein